MLIDTNLLKQFWVEAVYLINRCPTHALPDNTVPTEKWYGTKSNYSKLKLFGCLVYVCKAKIQVNDKFNILQNICL
jgi:hypothetical protein